MWGRICDLARTIARRAFLARVVGDSRAAADLFARTRLRMTVWYGGLVAAALLLFCVVLYFGARQIIIRSFQQNLQNSAAVMVQNWDQLSPFPCQTDVRLGPATPWACYDTRGHLLQSHTYPALTDPDVARRALASPSGTASSIVSIHRVGAIQRYAQVVVAPDGTVLGVVEIDAPVQAELNALNGLVALLIVLAVLVLAIAIIGGLFLGNRALMPLRLAYRRQREFVADAAHEFRTPLTLLRADAETLLRNRNHLPPDDASLVEDMVAETTHMGALSNRLLDLARLDAGLGSGETDVVDLAELTHGLTVRARSLADDRDVTIHSKTGAPVLVLGDAVLLEEAVLILIDNAIKYNRAGGSVDVSVTEDESWAVVTVRDTGVGIAAADVARLGERFFRVDKARSRSMGGAGLGLSIARRIAQQFGGSLTLDSEPGIGTTAVLSLPGVSTATRATEPGGLALKR